MFFRKKQGDEGRHFDYHECGEKNAFPRAFGKRIEQRRSLVNTGSNPNQIVRAAFILSAQMPHVVKALETRNPGPQSEGSTFLEPQTIELLAAANWEPANDAAIQAPAVGFTAPIAGHLGIVELAALLPETPCAMILGHKGTIPFVSPIIDREAIPSEMRRVEFTTLLLGPASKEDPTLVVWTFFPGGAIPPSTMEPSEATEAVKTVADAIALGFQYGKVGGSK